MVKLPDNHGSELIEMKRRPLLQTAQPPMPVEYRQKDELVPFYRDLLRPLRIDMPFSDLTVTELREVAKDMVTAWQQIIALTSEGNKPQYEILWQCRQALMAGKRRLPAHKGGRPKLKK